MVCLSATDDVDLDAGHPKHAKFTRLSKRLDWVSLRRAPREVSVLDDLSGPKPHQRDSELFPNFNEWFSSHRLH